MNLNELSSFDDSNYSEDYYENGLKKKLSGYENYHYIPTRSYSEAIEIINNFNFETVIDYGCAKGFLVHALRQLGKDAYGEDISEYAREHCHPRVSEFLSEPNDRKADLVIAKDILEHIHEDDIPSVLEYLKGKTNKHLFAVIPLGDNDTFRIREYEVDVTHICKKDEDWWIDKFRDAGFILNRFSYSMGGIKEKWIPVHPHGNGFFSLSVATE